MTLAALIRGIVGSKSTQLSSIAAHVLNGTRPESRGKRCTRWLRNDRITEEGYFLPFAEVLLAHLTLQTLVLGMDGSVMGRGGVALMLHGVYKGRALPVAWLVRHGKKGHFPEELHLRGLLSLPLDRPSQCALCTRWLGLHSPSWRPL